MDLSAINAGDRINHDLYAASPDAVRLIGDRLVKDEFRNPQIGLKGGKGLAHNGGKAAGDVLGNLARGFAQFFCHAFKGKHIFCLGCRAYAKHSRL